MRLSIVGTKHFSNRNIADFDNNENIIKENHKN